MVPSAAAIHVNRLGPPQAGTYPSIGETYDVFIVRIPFYLTFVWLPANKWICSRTYPRFCFTSSYDVLRGLLFIIGLMACSHMTDLKSELKQAKWRLTKKIDQVHVIAASAILLAIENVKRFGVMKGNLEWFITCVRDEDVCKVRR